MDSAPRADFAAIAASHHIFQVGTLSVLEAFSGNPQGERFAIDPHFAPYLTPAALDILRVKLPPRVSQGVKFAYAVVAIRAEHEAGVTILAGTDAPNPDTAWGVSLHREMELLTQCGLTPLQALQAATSAPAQAFFLVDRGRIEVGRRADLVLVNGDPSKDIRATRDVVSVWKAGRLVDRTKKK